MLQDYDLFLFDWSGTLSDDRLPVYRANCLMRQDYRLPILSYEEWLPTVGMSVVDAFRSYGASVSDTEISALYRKHLGDVVGRGVHPQMYSDASPLLHALRQHGKQLMVLSAHPQNHLEAEAQRYGIDSLFDRLIGDAFDKASVMRGVVDSMEVPAERVVYIGDTVTDMRAARSVGLDTIAVSTGYHAHDRLAAEEPHHLFTSLTEMHNALA